MNNEHIQKLIDVNPNPVIIAEKNSGRILYRNAAFCRTSITREDSLIESVESPEKEKLSRFLNAAGGSADFRLKNKNGGTLPITLNSNKFDEENVIVSFKDNSSSSPDEYGTELIIHEAAEELYSYSTKLETIVNSLPMVLLELDSNGIFVLQKGKALADAGFAEGQLLGQEFRDTLGEVKITLHNGEVITTTDAFSRVMKGEVIAGHTYIGGRFFDNYFVPVRKEGTNHGGLLGVCLDITERVIFEKSYRNTEQRFRLIAENTSELISMISKGEYIYISPAYEKLFGYSLDEIQNFGPKALVHPEDLPLLDKWQSKGMVEFRVRIKAGKYLWIEGESFLISGEPEISVGIARDVTKRKAAEDALKLSEERYRMLFERNPLPMFVYDEETLMFLAVNESAVQHYGYTKEEFLKMTIMDIRPNVDVPFLVDIIRTGGNRMKRFGMWRHILKNGVIINVEVTTHAITFNGRPARIVLADDVTAKVKAADALRESEEKYRMIVENANEGILVINIKGQTTFVNPKLAEILGYKREEIENKPVLDFLFEEDRTAGENYIRKNAEGSRETFQFRLRYRDGSERIVMVNAVPVFDERDAYAGGLALITDITRQRESEREREKLFNQITSARNRLKILSARLISVQESEKRSISRELHDEIGQMLTAVKIDVQRIKDGVPSSEIPELADDCIKLVEKTISVVRNLSLELRPAIIDDLGLAASLRWYLDKFHQRTGVEVKTEIEKISQEISPESAITLFRICQEALTNIAKHSEADYVKVCLYQNKTSVILSIEDNGKGFDARKALIQAARGKSLGLISMQERAELLGGKFSIKSMIGSGTVIKASCRVKN